jgi:Cu-processing system ATP-binding protein
MSGTTVELIGIAKQYGAQRAVEDVDLVLRQGECVALAGHNGAGKSTLIKLMLGLIRPTRGKVVVLGEDPAAGAAARARTEVVYLPENVALHPAMTGAETLAFYAKLKRQPVARNAALLERVGIAQAAKRRVGTYSKGMRQRLGLAQALLGAPKVLLLDEPTTGLDPALRQSFYEIVGELRDGGATVLLSSHALAELEGQADRVVIMNHGRKTADGTMSDLRRLAELPIRIRIRLSQALRLAVNEGGGPLDDWARLGERSYEFRCLEQDKVAAIQSLGRLSLPIEDVEILSPGLDDIYAHFLRRGGA